MNFPFLTVIVFLPLLAAVVLAVLKDKNLLISRTVALLATIVTFMLTVSVFIKFEPSAAFQFVEQYDWIPAMGISYFSGVDGINLLFLLLTTFLAPLLILASWDTIARHQYGFLIAILLMQVGLSGTFVALDLILFLFFLQSTLLPTYFLIGFWGNKTGQSAARKLILASIASSTMLLAGILVLYFYNGGLTQIYTFDFLELSKVEIPLAYQIDLFAIFTFGFAILIPVFPFHNWFKSVMDSAPMPASMLITAVFVKIGIYGFLRFCIPFFPAGISQFTNLFVALSIVGLLYGALCAITERKIMKFLTFVAFSHMAFIFLSIFSMNQQGISGALIHSAGQGLSLFSLIYMSGILYKRTRFSELESFGGLVKKIPVWTTFFGVVCFSLIGMPGLSGFAGEFLMFLGILEFSEFAVFCTAAGFILVVVYTVRFFQELAFGQPLIKSEIIQDITFRESLVIIPVIIFIVLIGVYPNFFLSKTEASVKHLINIVENSAVGYSIVQK